MKKDDFPLISVVITNYNYAKFLRESLSSALNQTYENLEIILIDDCSTDNSREIYENFAEDFAKKNPEKPARKIEIREHKKNRGIVFSRNEGLEISRGKYLIFLDADDFWDEDYIEKLFAKISTENLDVVYSDMKTFGDDNNLIEFPEFSLEKIVSRNIVNMGALMKKSAISAQKFDENLNRLSHEDWDFFLGLALSGKKFAKTSTTKLNYRIHENHRNAQKNLTKNFLNLLKINAYIIEKYRAKYPEKVDFTDDNEILEIYSREVEKNRENLEEIIKLRQNVDEKIAEINARADDFENRIEKQENEIAKILNSRAYKIGLKIMKIGKIPREFAKNIFAKNAAQDSENSAKKGEKK